MLRPYGRLWKANMLGPGNIAVSGEAAALEAIEPIATELGAMKVVRLAVAGAFHTPLMKPADTQLAEVLARTEIHLAADPGLLQCQCHAPLDDPRGIRRTLVAQVTPERSLGRIDAADARRRL